MKGDMNKSMSQKGLAPIVIVLIIAAIGFFAPIPYYEKEDSWCESNPPTLCSPKGWHLGPSLWQRFSGQLEKTVSTTIQPTSTPADETVYTEDTRSANWKTYRDSKNNYSLKYPAEWIAETPTGLMEPASLILKKDNQNSIQVIVQVTDKKSLDEWLSSIQEGKSLGQTIDKKRVTIDSVEAERTIIEYQGGGQVTVSTVNNGKSYQIIAPFKNNKEELLKDFDQILSTFKFTK